MPSHQFYSSPQPVKVLHIITRLIVGGAQENTMETCTLVNREAYQIELISGPQTGSEGSIIQEVIDRGINLTIIPELVREINPLKDLITLIKIFLKIKRGNYTIVHTHSSKAGIIGRLAAYLANTPIIIHTIHGWSFHKYMSDLKKWMYMYLERMAARITDTLIVVTENDTQKGLQNQIGNADQYLLIRSAIQIERFFRSPDLRNETRESLGIPFDVNVVGNVGRFSAQKNPLDWIRVAEIVARIHPLTYFLLVGDGPLKDEVVCRINQIGLADRFILPGLRRDVAAMLNAMDIFLITSLWEGLPRVIPQAMMVELPIVAYKSDGIEEILRSEMYGKLVPSEDIQLAADSCVVYINNKSLASKAGTSGRKYAIHEFSLDTMIQKIEDTYEKSLIKADLWRG